MSEDRGAKRFFHIYYWLESGRPFSCFAILARRFVIIWAYPLSTISLDRSTKFVLKQRTDRTLEFLCGRREIIRFRFCAMKLFRRLVLSKIISTQARRRTRIRGLNCLYADYKAPSFHLYRTLHSPLITRSAAHFFFALPSKLPRFFARV